MPQPSHISVGRTATGARVIVPLLRCHTCTLESPRLHNCGRCPLCCTCRVCTQCGRPVVYLAEVCRNCCGCCQCCACFLCSRCGNRVRASARCPVCSRCVNCCVHTPGYAAHFVEREMPRFWPSPVTHGQKIGTRTVQWTQRARIKADPLIRSLRYIAAEIEVWAAGAPSSPTAPSLDNIIQHWEAGVVHDGSLGSTGFEINTAPAIGSLFTTQINDICAALARQHGVVTPACGCHIHVDARDFGWYEIKRLIQLYAVIEPALYAIVPDHRRTSRYCYPCGQNFLRAIQTYQPSYVRDAKTLTTLSSIQQNKLQQWLDSLPPGHRARLDTTTRKVKINKTHTIDVEQQRLVLEHDVHRLRQALVLAVYGRSFRDNTVVKIKRNKHGDQRYRALNLHSWFHRGTIEWRLPEGTIDPITICMWGALFSRILDIAYQTPERVLVEMCRGVSFDTTQTDDQIERASLGVLSRLVPEANAWIQQRVQTYREMRSATSRLRKTSLPGES